MTCRVSVRFPAQGTKFVDKLKGLIDSLSKEINKSTYAVEYLSSTPQAWKTTSAKYAAQDRQKFLDLAPFVGSVEAGTQQLRQMRSLVTRPRNFRVGSYFFWKNAGGSGRQAAEAEDGGKNAEKPHQKFN